MPEKQYKKWIEEMERWKEAWKNPTKYWRDLYEENKNNHILSMQTVNVLTELTRNNEKEIKELKSKLIELAEYVKEFSWLDIDAGRHEYEYKAMVLAEKILKENSVEALKYE